MIPAFPPDLVKRDTLFEVEPFEVELAFSRIVSGGQEVFYTEKEKNSLSDLSHDVRKSFSANESYHFFFYIKDLKPVAVTYAFL